MVQAISQIREPFYDIDHTNDLAMIASRVEMLFIGLKENQGVFVAPQLPQPIQAILAHWSEIKPSYLTRTCAVIDNLMLKEPSQSLMLIISSSLIISDALRYTARYLELKPQEIRARPDFEALINHKNPQVTATRIDTLGAMEALVHPMRRASELMCDSIIGDVVQRCLTYQQAPQTLVEKDPDLNFIFMAKFLTDQNSTPLWRLCRTALSQCSNIMQLALRLLRSINTLHEGLGIGERSLYADDTRDILLQGNAQARQAWKALQLDGSGSHHPSIIPEAEDVWVSFST